MSQTSSAVCNRNFSQILGRLEGGPWPAYPALQVGHQRPLLAPRVPRRRGWPAGPQAPGAPSPLDDAARVVLRPAGPRPGRLPRDHGALVQVELARLLRQRELGRLGPRALLVLGGGQRRCRQLGAAALAEQLQRQERRVPRGRRRGWRRSEERRPAEHRRAQRAHHQVAVPVPQAAVRLQLSWGLPRQRRGAANAKTTTTPRPALQPGMSDRATPIRSFVHYTSCLSVDSLRGR